MAKSGESGSQLSLAFFLWGATINSSSSECQATTEELEMGAAMRARKWDTPAEAAMVAEEEEKKKKKEKMMKRRR